MQLTVNKAAPAITWATPAAITYGTALSATQLNASSTVAGTFVYTPAAGAVLTAGPQTLQSPLRRPIAPTTHGYGDGAVDGEQGHARDHLGDTGGDHLRHGAERNATQRQLDGGGDLRLHAGSGSRADSGFAYPLGDLYADRQQRLHDGDGTVQLTVNKASATVTLGNLRRPIPGLLCQRRARPCRAG